MIILTPILLFVSFLQNIFLNLFKFEKFNIADNLNFPQPTNKKRILIKSLNRFNTDGLKGTVNKY